MGLHTLPVLQPWALEGRNTTQAAAYGQEGQRDCLTNAILQTLRRDLPACKNKRYKVFDLSAEAIARRPSDDLYGTSHLCHSSSWRILTQIPSAIPAPEPPWRDGGGPDLLARSEIKGPPRRWAAHR